MNTTLKAWAALLFTNRQGQSVVADCIVGKVMPNPKAKRQRVLENIQRRNSWYREQFAERGKDVPAGAADNLAEVEKKTADAEQRLNQDDGAYFLDVAQSAQSFFEHNFARSGFFVKAGGTKGSRIQNEDEGYADQRAQWIRVARENLPPDSARRRGWKSKLARAVQGKCGGKLDTIRKALRRAGIFS